MSKTKTKTLPETETFEADIVNSNTVDWIVSLCSYLDRLDESMCPDSIRKTIEKTQTEFVKWVEKTMTANKIPTNKGIRIMSLDRDNRGQWSKHAARPEIKYSNDDERYIYYGNYDMVIAWFASGIITIWQSGYTSLAKFLGTPYEISEADFTPEPTPEPTPIVEEPEVEPVVETPTLSEKDKLIARKCNHLLKDLGDMHSIGSSTFRGSYSGECSLPMYNQWDMLLLGKFVRDKFIHNDYKLSLRKLTTLKKKVTQLNADVKNLDEHFARYNDFANLVISQCFNSAEYTMQFANGIADLIISSVNNVLENCDTDGQHHYAYKLAMEHKDGKELIDVILYDIYYGIYYGTGSAWYVRDILHRKDCVSSIANRIARNWALYNPTGDMAFDSPYLREKDDDNFKKHLCMMYPEMFGYKTEAHSYPYVVTPVEKFKKDYDNALAHFRSLFFILTWDNNRSVYAETDKDHVRVMNRPDHVFIDDKMWSIKVPDTEFLSAIDSAAQNDSNTSKIMEHLVDVTQVPEAYCYFDDTNLDAVHTINGTSTLQYIGNNLFRTLQDIVIQAVLAKTTDTHGDFSIEYVQNLLDDFAAKLVGKSITPTNEQYEHQYTEVKNAFIANTKTMLERIETLEKGLLASECPEFIGWCIKDQFVSKDLGEARLKELEEKAKEEATAEQTDVS